MRQLTIMQKKLLDRVMANDKEVSCWDELSIETIIELEKINDTEILSHEVNRYMHGKIMARIYS